MFGQFDQVDQKRKKGQFYVWCHPIYSNSLDRIILLSLLWPVHVLSTGKWAHVLSLKLTLTTNFDPSALGFIFKIKFF